MKKNQLVRLTDREIKALSDAASPILISAYSSGRGGCWDLQRAMDKLYRSQWKSAQQSVHPTAAGGSESGENSESGGG